MIPRSPRSFALSERSTSTSSYSRMASRMILPSLLNKNSMGILMSSVSFPSPAIWNRGAVSLLLPSLSSSRRNEESALNENSRPSERPICPPPLLCTCWQHPFYVPRTKQTDFLGPLILLPEAHPEEIMQKTQNDLCPQKFAQVPAVRTCEQL